MRAEPARGGITLAVANAERQLAQSFEPHVVTARRAAAATRSFPALEAAMRAFAAANGDAATR